MALVDHLGGLNEVALAVREKLGLSPDAGLRWITAAPAKRFGVEREPAEELARQLQAGLGSLPELVEALEWAIDLKGERLFALSPLLPRVRG